MKIEFTDTFAKSLRNLSWHESILYRTYSLFRYKIPYFFKNVWKFRNVLWNHRWWDYNFTLETLYTSVSILEDGMSKNGKEISLTRDKKLKKMRRSLEIMKNIMDGNYLKKAEDELGEIKYYPWEFEDAGNGLYKLKEKETAEEKEHNKKVYDRAREIEENEWIELWEIFKGQNYNEFNTVYQNMTEEEKNNMDLYYDWYDGSDLRGWWD